VEAQGAFFLNADVAALQIVNGEWGMGNCELDSGRIQNAFILVTVIAFQRINTATSCHSTGLNAALKSL
jgi:hypothetical protein